VGASVEETGREKDKDKREMRRRRKETIGAGLHI
jgi:hypothetical protein